jgi:hypothetical protein
MQQQTGCCTAVHQSVQAVSHSTSLLTSLPTRAPLLLLLRMRNRGELRIYLRDEPFSAAPPADYDD